MARRMGKPKAELVVRGKPILRFLLEQLRSGGEKILSTAPGRERPSGCELFDREVVDDVTDAGPLYGIINCLKVARYERVVFVTVDMPNVGREQIEYLLERVGDAGVMFRRSGEVEPFPCAIDRSVLSAIEERFAHGKQSVRGLAEIEGLKLLDVPSNWPESVWVNLNTPDDLKAIE
jgi:molybdopterin-guanine dinucleotide biosynthesis protein A